MHAVAVANVLGQQDGMLTTNGNNNAGGDLRVVTLAAMAAQHRPFGFTRVHRVPAIAAKFMRTIKLRQLYATSRKLQQPGLLIDNLPNRSHIIT